MQNDEFYYDMTDKDREKAVGYLLTSLLKSKVSLSEQGPNRTDPDEDVNIYLAHLMFAVATPQYRQVVDRYLSPYAGDVDRMIDSAEDAYVKYFIYKVNADHMLLHLSVFQDLGDEAPRSYHLFAPTTNQESGRATAYYDRAASFNHRIYRKQTAVGTVLIKLAERFEWYREILRATRRDYFHFVNTVSDDQFARFLEEINRTESGATLREKQDLFLDAYLKWREEPENKALRIRLEQLAQELKTLDPNFNFQLPSKAKE